MTSPKAFIWTKGFNPASKGNRYRGHCPKCGAVGYMVFTGKYDQKGNHVYICTLCKQAAGVATGFALCDLHDRPLEKDLFYTPCVDCPHKTMTNPLVAELRGKDSGICIYWKGRVYTDLPIADLIESAMKKFKVDTKQGGR